MNTVIYGFGIAGKWAVSHFDEVVAFVDTDMKKSGDDFLGISVEGPSYLDTLDYSETQVVVSVVDIMDVVPILEKKGVKNWVPLSSFIDLESPLVNGTGESDSFSLIPSDRESLSGSLFECRRLIHPERRLGDNRKMHTEVQRLCKPHAIFCVAEKYRP